jgi:hypothetical protein
VPKSAMPVLCHALVPEVLPAVMPDLPAVPAVLPAPLPDLVLPSRLPADLPAEGRAALAAALEGPLPAGQRPGRGEPVRGSVPSRWDDSELARLRGFLRAVDDLRGRQGRVYPLEYLLALPLIAGMAGDGELDAAAEWAATAPAGLLLRLGAPLDRAGKPRRPDATTIGRALAGCDQGQYDDALCAWSAARARGLRGMRRHLRIDGKAVRGAARGGRAPMLLSGIWDDGTTAAQLPVNVTKTNEIPVFRDLLKKVPDLAGAVISADQMHTQRRHARQIGAAGAFFVFTIGENQPRLFDAAGALPWESIAGEAWTVDRGHGRIDVRTWSRCSSSSATATARTGNCSARSPSSASPACRQDRPALLTCSPISAATGPSRCITMSAMSYSGRTPAASAARTGPWPPSATPSPASFTCTRSRTSPPSSAPITATLTSSRCSFSAS